nr:MAG TPA: hypothetical protein [Caudoviricetes sp.]
MKSADSIVAVVYTIWKIWQSKHLKKCRNTGKSAR